jgi:hypothetical protein
MPSEADENRIRNELACFWKAHPGEFVNMLIECLGTRIEDSTITTFHCADADDIPNCLVVFFKGYAVAQYAERAIQQLKDDLDTAEDEEDEEDDEDDEDDEDGEAA